MVQEIRKIVFTPEELVAAFEAYGRTTPKFIPAGKLLACEAVEQDGVRLTIEMEYGSATQQAEFIYRGMDVLRPLILFCIESNIMLPRDGRKSFANIDGRPVFMVELNLDLDLSAAAAPMMGEHIRLIKTDEPAKHRNS
jgi:hypothetical protein